MRVERAGTGDSDAIAALLEEAARWLTTRGIHQWTPGALPRAWVDRSVARGEFFVVRADAGALAATLALVESDPDVWGDDDGDALYLHRLAVARAHAGRALGRALLDWAAGEVAARGRRRLRLDCVATNTVLRRYYAAAGFAERGEVPLHGQSLARFEREL